MQETSMPGSDPPDVEQVYGAFGRELWARLYAQCCDRDLAREALQEAFVRLLEAKDASIVDPRAWLFRVGRNWLIDAARRRRHHPGYEGNLEEVATSAGGPASSVLTAELHGQVRAALARLEPHDREVLALKYALDWNTRRIATALGLTPGAVDMRVSRARRRIAELLSTSGVDHGIE